MSIFDGIRNLAGRGVSFERRDFDTSDARLFAYDFSFIVPTGIAGLTGTEPNFNYINVAPPQDFNYHVPQPYMPNDAPVQTMNPLLTPDWAMSFLTNVRGHPSLLGKILGG